MIRKVFANSAYIQLGLFYPKLTYNFAGFEPKVDHSIVSNINQLRTFDELLEYYLQNQSSFNNHLYAIMSRKFGRLLKDRQVNRGIKLQKSQQFKQYIEAISELDFTTVGVAETKSFLFMLRTLKQKKNYNIKQFQVFQKKIVEKSNQLAASNKFTLAQLINVYYDLSVLNVNINEIIKKIDELFTTNQKSLQQERNKVESYHLFIFLSGFMNRIYITKGQENVLSQIIKFIIQKINDIPLNDLVKIMNCLNSIRLEKTFKISMKNIVKILQTHVCANINQLQISSIFNILSFQSVNQDSGYSKIYQQVQDNLFSSISAQGQTFIDIKILFDCLRGLSSKVAFIKRPTYEEFDRLLTLIDRQFKKEDKKKMLLTTKDIGVMISNGFFTNKSIQKLIEITLNYTNQQMHFRFISQMSKKSTNLAPLFKNINQIKYQRSLTYFINMAVAVETQLKANPKDSHLQKLSKQCHQRSKSLTAQDIQTMAVSVQPNNVRAFHKNFAEQFYSQNLKKQLIQKRKISLLFRYIALTMGLKQLNQVFSTLQDQTKAKSLGEFFRHLSESNFEYYTHLIVLLFIQKNLEEFVQKKSWAVVYNILSYLSSITFKRLFVEQKIVDVYSRVLDTLAQNLEWLNQTTNLIQFFLARIINDIKSRRIASSLQFYIFMKKCKKHLKVLSEDNRTILCQYLSSYSLLSHKQLKQNGISLPQKFELQEHKFLSQKFLGKMLNNQQNFSQNQRQKILQSISKCESPFYLQQALIQVNIINTHENRKIIEKILQVLTKKIQKWQYIKIFVIIDKLKYRYKMQKSASYSNLINSIFKKIQIKQNFFSFNIRQHCQFLKEFEMCNIQTKQYALEVQKYYLKYNLQKHQEYQSILRNSQALTPEFVTAIPKGNKQLWMTILSQKYLENPQQAIKNILQKIVSQNHNISYFILKYISNKYPNLKTITQKQYQNSKLQIKNFDQKIQSVLKQVQGIEGMKLEKKQFSGKNKFYYEINGIPLLKSQKYITTKRINQFNKNFFNTIFEKEVLLFNNRRDLIEKLIQKFPKLQQLKNKDKDIEEDHEEQKQQQIKN